MNSGVNSGASEVDVVVDDVVVDDNVVYEYPVPDPSTDTVTINSDHVHHISILKFEYLDVLITFENCRSLPGKYIRPFL